MGYKADFAFPLGSLTARIDAPDHPHAVEPRPLVQFVHINKIGYGARAVDNRDLAIVGPILQRVPDGAADGRHGNPTAEKDQVMALPRVHGVAVAVGSAEPHDVVLLDLPQRLGYTADLAETELDAVLPVRTGADVERGFAIAEGREDAELADVEGKSARSFRIEEPQRHGFHILRLLADRRDFHQVGFVDVIHV